MVTCRIGAHHTHAMVFAGFWQQILQFMAMLAVVTNFAIISYTKLDTGPEWSECVGSCQDEFDPWGRG